jgi:hypothetical protein
MNKMKRSTARQIATVAVLLITAIGFIYYFRSHPAVGTQLRQASNGLLALLIGLYMVSFVILALVTDATLRLCRTKLESSENLLLTAYTAIINFFGPLQSGPAFRAVYLKAKHDISLKNYAAAALVYYFFWGVFSSLMLLSGLLKWWLVVLAALIVTSAFIFRKHPLIKGKLQGINLNAWYYLALATLAQVLIVSLIYFVELRSVAPSTSFSQAIIYTGAANLALFVSITPGAIGFRESFLLFSQHLHHVSSTGIVAASILDRAVYVVVLAGLAVFIFGSHAHRRLKA